MISTTYPNNTTSILLEESTSDSFNMLNNVSPPCLGCLISDKDGKTLFKYEVFEGALDFYLKKDIEEEEKKISFDVELIPMFISALERFSQEINIQDLAGFKLKGTNIKMHIIFCFNNYTVIFFLNPNINFKLIESRINNYFNFFFDVHMSDFNNVKKMCSRHFISHLELLGRVWLKDLNNSYMKIIKS